MTIVGILDRNHWAARTDVMVVVSAWQKKLTWIPRDLYSPLLGERINVAWKRGQGQALLACVNEFGFSVTEYLCVKRSGMERILGRITCEMPIVDELAFRYPLRPDRPIEAGEKRIVFRPPRESLRGERLHQWIGARYGLEPGHRLGGDISRIERQQRLLKQYFRSGDGVRRPRWWQWRYSSRRALADLFLIGEDWTHETFAIETLVPRHIDGNSVLVFP